MKRIILLLALLGSPAFGECITVELIDEPQPDPQLGPSWTYPGNIYSHLSGTHEFDASGMTRKQAEDYHSDLHNAESLGMALPVASWLRSNSDCPGGVCPVNQVSRSRSVVRLSGSAAVVGSRDSTTVRRRLFRGRIRGWFRWWRR